MDRAGFENAWYAQPAQASNRPPWHWRLPFNVGDEKADFVDGRFNHWSGGDPRRFERIGRTFLAGYRAALFSGPTGPDPRILQTQLAPLQGFMAEGAGMGCVVADAVTPGSRRLQHWLQVAGQRHTYLIHVGAGWAFARVPFVPARVTSALDPVHHWLVYDGLGFHDAYFRPRWVEAGGRRFRSGRRARAWDQGVGRALWFLACGEPDWVASMIARQAPGRQSDLWAGLGLAITYAGGTDSAQIEVLRDAAGARWSHVRQGAAFAAAARAQDDTLHGEHAEIANLVTGRPSEDVLAEVMAARARLTGGARAYEVWRGHVRRALTPTGDGS